MPELTIEETKKWGMDAVDTANWPEHHLDWFDRRIMDGMDTNVSDILSLMAVIRKERAQHRAAMQENAKLREALTITHKRCKALGWSEPELRLIEEALSSEYPENPPAPAAFPKGAYQPVKAIDPMHIKDEV